MKRLAPEIPSWLIIGLAAGLSAFAWSRVTEPMALHWDMHGAVDRTGSRAEGLLALPGTMLAVYLLMALAPKLGFNHALFARTYDVLRTAILAFLLLIHAAMITIALGHPLDMLAVVGGLGGLLFIVVGNAMGKLRPNAYAGVRTPWTLTSKRSWTRTHRLAGFLFIGTGLITCPLALVSGPLAVGALTVGALGSSLGAAAYSWHVWRLDPDRGLS